MKVFVILPVVCLIMLLGSFTNQESFGEQLDWRLGDGLKKGDVFSYELCHVDYKECTIFQIDFWIQGDKQVPNEPRWNSKVAVYDGNKIITGDMELGKPLPEPTGSSSEISIYRKAFKSSITSITTFDNADMWSMGPRIAFIYNDTEKITTRAGTFDTHVMSWKIDDQTSKVWVAEGFPFPVKAKTFDRAFNGTNPILYEFELRFHKEGILEDPFIPVIISPPFLPEKEQNNKHELMSPLKQFKSGIPFHEIQCKNNLQLTQRYDGTPACVKQDTYFELIKRNWTSEIIKAVQSRDLSIPELELNLIPEEYGVETNTKENYYISPFDEEQIHEFQENYHTVITGKVIEWYGQKQPSKYDYQYRVEALAYHTPRTQEDSVNKILGYEDNFIPVNADVVLFGLDKDEDGFLYIVNTVIMEKPEP